MPESRRGTLEVVLVALAASVARGIVSATRTRIGIDEAQFSSVAACARAHGESLYATPYSQWRPCVTFAFYLSSLITGEPFALALAQVFATLFVLATAVLLAHAVREAGRSAQLATAALYPLAILAFEGAATRAEVFANAFVAGALVVRLLPGFRFQSLAFGALLGAAGTEKPQYLALALLAPALSRTQGAGPWLKEQIEAAIGFVLPPVLHWTTVASSAGAGAALGPFAEYASSYTTSAPQRGLAGNLAARLAPTLWDPVWLLALARALSVVRDPAASDLEKRLARGLGVSLVPVFLGLRLARHYFLVALPLAVPLAALALVRFVAAARDATPEAVEKRSLARTALVALALLGVSEGFYLGASGLYAAPSDDSPWRTAARAIAERTQPGQRIFVWGWRPELYAFSNRAPSSHYVDGMYQARDFGPPDPGAAHPVDESSVKRLVAELERDPPVLFVDASAVSNNNPQLYDLRRFPALVELIAKHYDAPQPLAPRGERPSVPVSVYTLRAPGR